jgi:hypothetical protein
VACAGSCRCSLLALVLERLHSVRSRMVGLELTCVSVLVYENFATQICRSLCSIRMATFKY